MQSPKSSNRRVRVRYISPPQPAVTPSEYFRRGTIWKLSDDVLLNIFRYFLGASPRLWPRLTHICRKWRHIVFASQRALRLRLLCTHGTPVLKTLDCWPTLPIVVQYGGPPVPSLPATEDEENIMAALKQSDRVTSIGLIVTNSLLERLSAIKRPFSELEELVLLSQDSVSLTLPSSFRWGLHLHTLHLTRIAIPAFSELLSPYKGLVDLRLHETPSLEYFAPNAFANALSGMTYLRSLSLHFLSPALSQNYVDLPPQSGERVVLPALTCLKYRGSSSYLDSFVARIDAPRLGDIDINFSSQPTMKASQLARFINRIEFQRLHRQATILYSEQAISISFSQPDAPSRLLQISCKPLSWELSRMAQICNALSVFLLGVDQLRICVMHPTSRSDEEWLRLTRIFRGAKWVHVVGEHSTNIVLALHRSKMRREIVLPALCKLCIREPEPRYAPLRDAVASFIHSHRVSGHIIAVEYERLWINKLLGTGGPLSQQVMIKKLSDDVLLNIFHHFLHASPQFWHTLTHVCQKWRQIIFESPLGLRLRLHCTYGTPVLKTLGYWPPFPLVVNYHDGVIHRPPAPEDEDNIMAALQHTDRVRSISLTVSSQLLKKLSTISKPFLELEDLVLLSKDDSTLPTAFWWGHRLRTLHSTRVAFPSLPQLLLPSQNLVDIQLDEIPSVGYFPPEAFANALCGMTQLQTLSLHFLSLPPRRKYLSLPSSPRDRVVLPVLTHFKYRGISKYLDIFVARIDAPRLRDIDIRFFNQPTLDASQLGGFINRIELWTSPHRADILSSEGTISITFTQPGAFTRLGLQISCEQLDWQLSSISQICGQFSSFIFNVEELDIKTAGSSSVPDDMDNEQWLRLIRAFVSAKGIHVPGEFVVDILHALRLADEGHDAVLPALQNLHIMGPTPVGGPLRDTVNSFVSQRQLSDHPVRIYIGGTEHFRVPAFSSILSQSAGAVPIRRPTAEEVTSAKRWVDEQKRLAFNHSFDGVAGSSVAESEIQEYTRNLERLDMVLGNIEKYIHIAFAALRKEDVVRRMFAMMASTKFQLEESKKPNPRYVLELHTIRGMIQEAGNMDRGLRTFGTISEEGEVRLGGSTNEEARKRDEQAESVKTDEQALAFFETVTKFIDENPESAEAASNALYEILRTYPSAPDIDDATMASSGVLLPFR